MKTKTKRFWLALLLVTAFAVAAVMLWKQEPPQIITLPNGEKYQFAGVTYSTRPVPPALLARVTPRLPAPVANLIRKHFWTQLNWYNSSDRFPTPRLFVWFLPMGANTTSPSSTTFLATVLANQDGAIAGAKGVAVFSRGVGWAYTSFSVVPRRSRDLQCEFFTPALGRGTVTSVGKVTFRNPLFGRFPQWQPEPIPAIKKAGDLEVRLDEMRTERPLTNTFSTSYHISLRSPEGTKGAWALESAELSDATGNVLRQTWPLPGTTIQDVAQPLLQSDGWFGLSGTLLGTLWPGEPAWRLRLQWKRAADWTPGELVTFRNVPLLRAGATNTIWMTNTVGPSRVVLEEHMRWLPTEVKSLSLPKFRLEVPDGFAADAIRMTTDSGIKVPMCGGAELNPGSRKPLLERFYCSTVLSNAATVDITWVVQKTRTVEFLVKPPKAE